MNSNDSSPKRPRGDRPGDVDHDRPPFSRVFIVCSKSHTADDIREKFNEYGTIEDVWIVKDRETKQSRGIAYVKYEKMSEATLAVEEMDGMHLKDSDEKHLKVIIAQPKSTKRTDDLDDETALTRLFVVVPKEMDEADLKEYFEKYGDVEYTQVMKDRKTGDHKGFAYIKFRRPYHAAVAVESAERQFRAIIAEPKGSRQKREASDGSRFPGRDFASSRGSASGMSDILSRNAYPAVDVGMPLSISNKLIIRVHKSLGPNDLGQLFDLIPGMKYFDIEKDPYTGESLGIASVVYNSVGSAIYAKEKLHGFNYPLGTKLSVSYSKDEGDRAALDSKFSQDEFYNQTAAIETRLDCSVKLPSKKPLASENSSCALRLFIVCVGSLPPSDRALNDIFSRFGDLIEVYLLNKKNCGFAKYASAESGREAISVLNGADVCGVRLKVMEAEPPRPSAETIRKRPREENR